ncbi:MAG: hypothetical protein QNJ78_06345 [Gammaproteobacteria bacterium]|nr:hypothetical protein [Gammaproteobacteria bacterium]
MHPSVGLEDKMLVLRLGGFDDDDITIGDSGLTDHTTITMNESGSGTGTVSGGAGYFIQTPEGDTDLANFALTRREEFRTLTLAIRPGS